MTAQRPDRSTEMDHVSLHEVTDQTRVGRISVLAWHPKNGEARNLFTHIRHRRDDGSGPWTGEPDQIWRTTSFPSNDIVQTGEIKLHRRDAPLKSCMGLVESILNTNTMAIDGVEVSYALEPPPRCHWAYRDRMKPDDHSVNSPFTGHSARVIEFWSLAPEPHHYWREVCESYPPRQLEGLLSGLGFGLDQRLDRVGNLMISGAEDELDCELISKPNHLILDVTSADGTDLTAKAYFATVWTGDSDDTLVHQHFEMDGRHTVISVDTAVDLIGFAIYRRSDGQCIDIWETGLVREITGLITLSTSRTLEIRDSQRGTTNSVGIGDAKTEFKVEDKRVGALDAAIRQAVIGRRSWLLDRDARRAGNHGRFEPEDTQQAIDFFLRLVSDAWRSDGPVYLADPYFMQRDFVNTDERIYSSLFSLTKGQPLRILCGPQSANAWLSNYPSILTSHVAVRSFTRKDSRGQDKPSVHDRCLITPDKEIIITHSINGWHDDGVTFATLPYGVYRARAEELWSMNIGYNNGVQIREVTI